MIASELASELSIDPSIMSKRLQIYRAETGEGKTYPLTPETVEHMRHAHGLVATGQANTFKIAIKMTLGTFTSPVPSESVRALESRLERLEAVQAQTLDSVSQILQHIEGLMGQESRPEEWSGQ